MTPRIVRARDTIGGLQERTPSDTGLSAYPSGGFLGGGGGYIKLDFFCWYSTERVSLKVLDSSAIYHRSFHPIIPFSYPFSRSSCQKCGTPSHLVESLVCHQDGRLS